jgi:hypothetical protein
MTRRRRARHLTTATAAGCAPRRWACLFKKDTDQVRREAQHEAAFEATVAPSRRQLHEEGLVAKDAEMKAALMEELERPKPKPMGTQGQEIQAQALPARVPGVAVQGLRNGPLPGAHASGGPGSARTAARGTASTGAGRPKAKAGNIQDAIGGKRVCK